MSSRDRLLEAGLELFHRYGIYPVGLDRILSQAGVTKTTFYKYFESKEAFVCAVLDCFAEELLQRINAYRSEQQSDQELTAQLLGTLNAWDNLHSDKTFRGCLLISAGVASADPNDPARVTSIRHKRRILEAFESIASTGNLPEPTRFAARFVAILDSSLISRQLYGDQKEAKETFLMAEQLIAESIRKRNSAE